MLKFLKPCVILHLIFRGYFEVKFQNGQFRNNQTICRTPLIPPKHRNSNKKHLTFRNNPTFRHTNKNGISTVLKTNSLIISAPSNALNKLTLPNNPTI